MSQQPYIVGKWVIIVLLKHLLHCNFPPCFHLALYLFFPHDNERKKPELNQLGKSSNTHFICICAPNYSWSLSNLILTSVLNIWTLVWPVVGEDHSPLVGTWYWFRLHAWKKKEIFYMHIIYVAPICIYVCYHYL